MFNNKSTTDFDDLADHSNMFFEEMDSNMNISGSNPNREVYPEFSDPTDYTEFLPLKNTTNNNNNIKQGIKFFNKEQFTKHRLQPYNRPTSSNKTVFINSTTYSHQSNGKIEFKNKEHVHPKQSFKINTSCNNNNNNNNEEKPRFNMVVKNKPNLVRSSFVMENKRSDDSGNLSQRTNFPGSKYRHLIGSVDQVLRWHKSEKDSDLSVIYEAHGTLEFKRSQGLKQLLFIRGESGHTLQAVFYEIDRPIPMVQIKSSIVVTGRMTGFRKMQIYDVAQLNEEDHQAIKRVSFLSQRALNEALNE